VNIRGIALALAAFGIPVALLLLVLPMTWGYGGYRWRPIANTGGAQYQGVITYVDPSGPGARAGLHEGERVKVIMTGSSLIDEIAGPVGTVDRFGIVENGRTREVRVTFVPYSGALGAQQQISKLLNALTALCAFIVMILVLLRGRKGELASRAAYVLLFAGARALSQGLALIVYYGLAAIIFYRWLPPLLLSITLYAALWMLAVFPREGAAFRRLIARIGIVGVVLALAFLTYDVMTVTVYQSHLSESYAWLQIALGPVLALSILHAMARAKDVEAVPTRWLGTMWLIAVLLQAFPFALTFAHVPIGESHYFDAADTLFVFFLTFGVAYPILRHRIVDLNILVSRATVFTVVSLIIVCIFVAAEWAIGKIFEHSLGFSGDRGGLAAQAATLAVVLLLGISARSIHAFVENRLSQVFFRKRLEALREIERVAQETDAATDAAAVTSLAVDTVARWLQPMGVALYLRDGERYICERTRGNMEFVPVYDYNDPILLRLRRWLQPFETAAQNDEQLHVLFLPMTLRGDVLGFIACGPKPDHTAYLDDEIAALSMLAHHAGIASAWLSRPSSLPALRLSPSS
jgi:hypothetical protein